MEHVTDVIYHRGTGDDEQLVQALVAARLEQRLHHGFSKWLDEVLEELLPCMSSVSSLLESAASRGRHELLGAILRCIEERWSRIDNAVYVAQELSAAWLAAAGTGQPKCLRLILDTCNDWPGVLEQLLRQTTAAHEDLAPQKNALMLAAESASPGHVECVRMLLEHGPDAQVAHTSCSYSRGYNALIFAAMGGATASMELLLAHSPEVQVAANHYYGMNALMHAALHGHTACMRLLLAHSPQQQVEAADRDGMNALIHASRNGHVACLQLLLAHSPAAQLAQQCWDDRAGSTSVNALWMAGRLMLDGSGDAACLFELLEARAGRECVELLVAHGAQLPDGGGAEVHAIVWPFIQEWIVGLALGARGASLLWGAGQQLHEGEMASSCMRGSWPAATRGGAGQQR